MVVDFTLTWDEAIKAIGRTLKVESPMPMGGKLPVLEDYLHSDPPLSKTSGAEKFHFLGDGETCDYTWRFRADSSYMQLLKKLTNSQASYTSDRTDADSRAEYSRVKSLMYKAYGATGITGMLESHQANWKVDGPEYGVWLESVEPDAKLNIRDKLSLLTMEYHYRIGYPSIVESLRNAIEHGSNFGEHGDVTFRYIGGEFGAVALIDDPGTIFDFSQDDLAATIDSKKHAVGQDNRGNGLRVLSDEGVQSTRVHPHKHDDGFRVLILYDFRSVLPYAQR
jgi:hypothetical protein